MTDEEQIRHTIGQFCHFLDSRRFKEFSELFVDDGVFAGATAERKGRGTIYDWISTAELAQNPDLRRRHVATNTIIDVNGDEADAVSDLLMFDCVAKADWTIKIGRYTDHLVRTPDGWRFARRHLVLV